MAVVFYFVKQDKIRTFILQTALFIIECLWIIISTYKSKGGFKMNTSQRIRTIRLIELMKQKPDYSKQVGLSSKDLVSKKEKKNVNNEWFLVLDYSRVRTNGLFIKTLFLKTRS